MANRVTRARGQGGEKLLYHEKKIAYSTTFNKRLVYSGDGTISAEVPIEELMNSDPSELLIPIDPSPSMLGNTFTQDLNINIGSTGGAGDRINPQDWDKYVFHTIDINSISNNQPVQLTNAELLDYFLSNLNDYNLDSHGYITLIFEANMHRRGGGSYGNCSFWDFKNDTPGPLIVGLLHVPTYIRHREKWNLEGYKPTSFSPISYTTEVNKNISSSIKIQQIFTNPLTSLDLWKDLDNFRGIVCIKREQLDYSSTLVSFDGILVKGASHVNIGTTKQDPFLRLVAIDLMNKVSERFISSVYNTRNNNSLFDEYILNHTLGYIKFTPHTTSIENPYDGTFLIESRTVDLICPLYYIEEIAPFLYEEESLNPIDNDTTVYPLAGLYLGEHTGTGPVILTPTNINGMQITSDNIFQLNQNNSIHKKIAIERLSYCENNTYSYPTGENPVYNPNSTIQFGQIRCFQTPFMCMRVLDLAYYQTPFSGLNFYNIPSYTNDAISNIKDPMANWFELAQFISNNKEPLNRYNLNKSYLDKWYNSPIYPNNTDLDNVVNFPTNFNLYNMNGRTSSLRLTDVIFNPDFKFNLVSEANKNDLPWIGISWVVENNKVMFFEGWCPTSYVINNNIINAQFAFLVFKPTGVWCKTPTLGQGLLNGSHREFFMGYRDPMPKTLEEQINVFKLYVLEDPTRLMFTRTNPSQYFYDRTLVITTTITLDPNNVPYFIDTGFVNSNFFCTDQLNNRCFQGWRRRHFSSPTSIRTISMLNLYPFWRRLGHIHITSDQINDWSSYLNTGCNEFYDSVTKQKIIPLTGITQLCEKLTPHLYTAIQQCSNIWSKKHKLFKMKRTRDPIYYSHENVENAMIEYNGNQRMFETVVTSRYGSGVEDTVRLSSPLFTPMIAQLTGCDSLQVNNMLNFSMGMYTCDLEHGQSIFTALGDSDKNNYLEYSAKPRILKLTLSNAGGYKYPLQQGSQTTVVFTIKTYLRSNLAIYRDLIK